MRSNKGFTLVEMAIVLVIIGLLLGGVLKGQELINNAKVKRLYSQQREVTAAIYTYFDKYGKYPGDDNLANTRGFTAGTTAITNGNNDGVITGLTLNCAAGSTAETCQAWYHMRLSNILSGADTTAPGHPYGGTVGVGYGAIQGLTTQWIGFLNVPGDVCATMDQMYDDGSYSTGSIRGSGNYNTTPNQVWNLYFRL